MDLLVRLKNIQNRLLVLEFVLQYSDVCMYLYQYVYEYCCMYVCIGPVSEFTTFGFVPTRLSGLMF